MTRHLRLWHALTLLTGIIAAVAFLVGYLDAQEGVPDVAAAQSSPPPQIVSGQVIDASGPITIGTFQGGSMQIEIPPDAPVLASLPGARADIAPGDLVIVGIASNESGGQAVRAVVVVPGGGNAANP